MSNGCLAHHPGYNPNTNLFPGPYGRLHPCRFHPPGFYGPPPPPPPLATSRGWPSFGSWRQAAARFTASAMSLTTLPTSRSSSPSAITRISGSVPEARTSTRPEPFQPSLPGP